ncbi:hypothetical protein [Paraclostridium dentum]|uniref:hypothetical protein n=1 Tax=Paraclostridium dentum TaxID=2662455 RepID=UPI003F3355C4
MKGTDSYSGAYLRSNQWYIEKNKKYVLEYEFKKISGEHKNIGGHVSIDKIQLGNCYIDGVKRNAYNSATNDIADDTKTHKLLTTFTAKVTDFVTHGDFYIQPNRGNARACKIEITSMKLYEYDNSSIFNDCSG